jgi:hypothetical protein
VDAADLINDVETFFNRVVNGEVEALDRGTSRDQPVVKYEQEGGRLSFRGPKGLFEEFQSHLNR